MGDAPQNALIHIDGEAATTAIKETSRGIGGFFRPWQIKRVAKADAAAALIKASSDIEISELQQRALHRFLEEEACHQSNMEAIAELAMPQLTDGADREKIDDDWMSNFFDKCRSISNNEMQTLWSRVLADEANEPGSFSKRTVNFMANLDRTDCQLFTKLCCFCLGFGDTEPPELIPFVVDPNQPIYRDNGIRFDSLIHLDSIGLIKFASSMRRPLANEAPPYFSRENATGRIPFHYFDTKLYIEVGPTIDVGCVIFTQVGNELARIAGGTPVPGFLDYVRARARWAHLLRDAF